jgi:hypothetical protein
MSVFRSLKAFAVAGVVVLAAFASQPQARSAGILYSFDQVFSGSSPAGAPAWFSVALEDVEAGTVRLSLSALNLQPGEKITELYLNLNPSFLANNLQFTFLEGTAGVIAPQPSLGLDAFRADGDGLYDIRFQFSQPPAGAFRLDAHLTYLITGTGLTANDFGFLSMPAGGHGPFYSAIHIQGLNADGVNDTGSTSGWISPGQLTELPVPEPSAAMLAVLGGAVAIFRRSVSGRKQSN